MDDVEREGGGPGAGGATGVPAGDTLPDGSITLTGHHQTRHWRESTITDDDLSDRGGVFFAAVEMTRMPMILTDPRRHDNPIVFANKAFLDLTGYEEREVLNRNCRFLQGPRTDREHVAQLRHAVETHDAVSLEILNYKRDGTPFWNAVFIGPVFAPDGELLYFFASQLDVTRRRESEEARRHSQKMEAVGQLTAGLAHDFNNLLQVVAGNHELLLRDVEEPKAKRRLENAQGAVDRAARLTRQLLAFARKTRLDPKRLDLSAAVAGFADLLETTAGSSLDLRLDLLRRLPPCMVDEGQLETALLNVVANARDAMAGTGPGGAVSVSTSKLHRAAAEGPHKLPPGDYVVLEVSDTGPGMAPAVLARASEPFFTTKKVGKGTGLGLAMVHGFVEQSHGRLEIESEPGRGTTVRMLFPVAAAAAGSGDEEEEPAPQPVGRASSAAAGATVLVVDDTEDVLALARDHLVELGYDVLTASDGDEALAVLERTERPIDLLFTDLVMPGSISGLELAERVRARLPGVPVLLTTGYNEELVGDAQAAGADVLGKPYRRAELADRVRAALAGAGEDGARRRPSDFGSAQA